MARPFMARLYYAWGDSMTEDIQLMLMERLGLFTLVT